MFPSLQGRPCNDHIVALVVALKQAMTLGFKAYARQIEANVVNVGNYLMNNG